MSKHYKAILFDMDGTLLPMDMKEFMEGYFRLIAPKFEPFGITHEALVPAIWKGTEAMVMNDGSRSNYDAFWDCFKKLTGVGDVEAGASCLAFYSNEFKQAKAYTQENPLAAEAVRLAHECADYVALATNPVFPMDGQVTRMGFVGLKPSDFDMVTSYENSRFCKPNPKYFLTICDELGADPHECLMIGNDEREDGYAADQAGLATYIITDCMIARPECHYSGPKGNFKEMLEYLKKV